MIGRVCREPLASQVAAVFKPHGLPHFFFFFLFFFTTARPRSGAYYYHGTCNPARQNVAFLGCGRRQSSAGSPPELPAYIRTYIIQHAVCRIEAAPPSPMPYSTSVCLASGLRVPCVFWGCGYHGEHKVGNAGGISF